MTNALLIATMVLVVFGFLALAMTDSAKVRATMPNARRVAVALWWVILIAGWGVFAWLALAAPGGLSAASAWVAAQPVLMRVAMWLFLLPWTAALALWGSGLPEAVRVFGVLGVAVLTFGLAARLPATSAAN